MSGLTATALVNPDRVLLKQIKRHSLQGLPVCIVQEYSWRHSFFVRLKPSSGTKTPPIALFQAGKLEFRMRGRQIIAGEA